MAYTFTAPERTSSPAPCLRTCQMYKRTLIRVLANVRACARVCVRTCVHWLTRGRAAEGTDESTRRRAKRRMRGRTHDQLAVDKRAQQHDRECAGDDVVPIVQGRCGTDCPGTMWYLLSRDDVAPIVQGRCGTYCPGTMWHLLSRDDVAPTVQGRCGTYCPGTMWHLLSRELSRVPHRPWTALQSIDARPNMVRTQVHLCLFFGALVFFGGQTQQINRWMHSIRLPPIGPSEPSQL